MFVRSWRNNLWLDFESLEFLESLIADGIKTFLTAGGRLCKLTTCALLSRMMGTFMVQGPQTVQYG